MSAPIVAPIVLVEGVELTVYDSVEALTADLEPWYPTAAEHSAYDAEGRRLELVADPPVTEQRILGLRTDTAHESDLLVRVRDAAPAPEELARHLRAFLGRAGVPQAARDALSLSELIARARDHAG